MSFTDALLANNQRYAAGFTDGGLPMAPAGKTAVLACMDARLNVCRILGLRDGDAHIIRNAGGVATEDALRSLTLSQRLQGTTEIVLLHHTDCGMLKFTDDWLKQRIKDEVGVRPAFDFEAFSDLEEDVRRSIDRIKSCPFLPHTDRVRGFVYEVESGRLREVAG